MGAVSWQVFETSFRRGINRTGQDIPDLLLCVFSWASVVYSVWFNGQSLETKVGGSRWGCPGLLQRLPVVLCT